MLFKNLIRFFFPTLCLHCQRKVDTFGRLLCKECLVIALEDKGSKDHLIWSPCSSESPFKSVWVFSKNKSYTQPLKDLAAFCCARWISIQDDIPEWIAFFPFEMAGLNKIACPVEAFSLELARFFGVSCIKAIRWHVDQKVFDRNGKKLSRACIESRMLNIDHKKGVLVCEKAAAHIAQELLQDIPILQLF